MKKSLMMALVAVGVGSSVATWAATTAPVQNVLIGFQGNSSDIAQVVSPNLPVLVGVKSTGAAVAMQPTQGDMAVNHGIKNTFAVAPSAGETVVVIAQNQAGNQESIPCTGATPVLVGGTMQVAYTVSVDSNLAAHCSPAPMVIAQ